MLMLLNSDLVLSQARALAGDVDVESGAHPEPLCHGRRERTGAAGNAAATAGKQAAGQAATEAASNAARAVVPYAAQGVAQQSLSAAAAQLTPLLTAQAASAPVEPGKEIDDRYRGLRDYVGGGPGAPICMSRRPSSSW